MIFDSLKKKCEYYRGLTDYRLMPNGYVLVMIDGKNFSKLIKNKFDKPFDDWFIETMNLTAEHLCKNIQNAVGAFTQSDEISLVIKDDSHTSMPFDGRMCKLLSIIPGMATAFFMKRIIHMNWLKSENNYKFEKVLEKMPDYLFDCKVWTVPNLNDAMAWFLYRQNDCIRNSKQQFCQTYVSHKQLSGLNSDEQVKLCIDKTGYDWNLVSDDKKYGRFLYKDKITKFTDDGTPYDRTIWSIFSKPIQSAENWMILQHGWFGEDIQ